MQAGGPSTLSHEAQSCTLTDRERAQRAQQAVSHGAMAAIALGTIALIRLAVRVRWALSVKPGGAASCAIPVSMTTAGARSARGNR